MGVVSYLRGVQGVKIEDCGGGGVDNLDVHVPLGVVPGLYLLEQVLRCK